MIMPDYNVTLAVVPIAETCDKGIKCYTSEISPFLWFILGNPKLCLIKHIQHFLLVNPIKDIRCFNFTSAYN